MENEIYYKKYKVNTFNELVEKYKIDEFKSPYRSTIPLLVLCKNQQWKDLGLNEDTRDASAKYIFEFETPVKRGKGRSSCSDLMIEYKNTCTVIEAKRTESPYESVKRWLGDSDNRKLVLDGWLEVIDDYIDSKIDAGLVSDLPYQLIHRVASACSMGKLRTRVIYLGFDLNNTKNEYYSKIINSFSKLLKDKVSIQLFCFQLDKSDEQKRLESLWDSGERDLSKFIKSGINNDTLMKLTQV